MDFYLGAKEIIKDVQKLREETIESKKIIGILRTITFLIVCTTFFVQYWNFKFSINIGTITLLPINLNHFIDNYTYTIFIVLIIYKAVGYIILRHIVISIGVKFNIKLFPVLNTVEDVFEIGAMIILSLYLINNLILCINGIYVIKSVDKDLYLIYLICCLCSFVNWVYIKNKEQWRRGANNYTPFFDCNGKQIAQSDKAIYYGELYDICLLDIDKKERTALIPNEKKSGKKAWYILKKGDFRKCEEVLLEDAVRDEKGKIKTYDYKIKGYKNE